MEFPNLRIDGQMTRVARENSRRNPGRTAATAAALMIGLALVTFVGTLANGMKASNRGAIEDQVKAEYIQTSTDGFTPFVAGAGDAIAKAPPVETASPVRYDLAKIDGSAQYLSGIDPATISKVYNFDWKTGSDATLNELGANGAVIDKKFAEQKHLKVGDTFPIAVSGRADRRTAVVRASTRRRRSSRSSARRASAIPAVRQALPAAAERVHVRERQGRAERRRAEAARGRGRASSRTPRCSRASDWITAQDKDFNNFLTFIYVLLALSVIVSLFGMINTLALSVYERTRELGMLRAVGTTRRQARRMIRHEGVITALIGAALGIPLGLFLALLVTKALSQFDVRYEVPYGTLIVFGVIAVVAGLVAALLPARRAARLNVLEALQYECELQDRLALRRTSRRRRLVLVADEAPGLLLRAADRVGPRRERRVVVGRLAQAQVAERRRRLGVVDAHGARLGDQRLDAVPRLVLEVEGEAELRVEGAEQQLSMPSSRGLVRTTRTGPRWSPRCRTRSVNVGARCRGRLPGSLGAKVKPAGTASAQRRNCSSAGRR